MLTGERIGFPRFIASQVLGHADGGGAPAVTRIYDRSDYATPKRQALDAWAWLLREIVDGTETPSNVVRLAG
jgi:hypothetical protein